uniref:Uncharacterized protein n=1 Tax=Globodera pallida TaxID=36090 RepID=A0A183CPB0_GLOPA
MPTAHSPLGNTIRLKLERAGHGQGTRAGHAGRARGQGTRAGHAGRARAGRTRPGAGVGSGVEQMRSTQL